VLVARVLLAIMTVGIVLVFMRFGEWQSLLGFALLGIGSSAIFPLAMSAAAQRTDRPAAVNVAALAQTSFVTFLLAPPILGFIAQHWGIAWSFGIGLPLVVLSFAFTHVLGSKPLPRRVE
jgi:MFS family permease